MSFSGELEILDKLHSQIVWLELEVKRLQKNLIDERASKALSHSCNCDRCWEYQKKHPGEHEDWVKRVKAAAEQSLREEGKL